MSEGFEPELNPDNVKQVDLIACIPSYKEAAV